MWQTQEQGYNIWQINHKFSEENMRNKAIFFALVICLLIGCGTAQKSTMEVQDDEQLMGNIEVDSSIDNSAFELTGDFIIFRNVDTAKFQDFSPKDDDGMYCIGLNKKTNMTQFSCYGSAAPVKTDVQAEFSSDIYYEIKDLIFKNQIEPYEFKTDENKKRIDSIEPYYIYFNYQYDGIHWKSIGINTPANIDVIISRLDELAEIAIK